MEFKQKFEKLFTSLVAISMVATAVVPATTMASEVPEMPTVSDEYTVSLSQTEGGTLAFVETQGDVAMFAEGDEVKIDIETDSGYQFSKIMLAYADGELAAEGEDDVASYSFTMPAEDIYVSAQWKVLPEDLSENLLSENLSENEYMITLVQSDGGEICFPDVEGDSAAAVSGNTVTIEIFPDDNHVFAKLTVADATTGEILLEDEDQPLDSYDTSCAFTMPETNLLISVEWYERTEVENESGVQTLANYLPSGYDQDHGYLIDENTYERSLSTDELYVIVNKFITSDKYATGSTYRMVSSSTVWSGGTRWDCSSMVNYFTCYYLLSYADEYYNYSKSNPSATSGELEQYALGTLPEFLAKNSSILLQGDYTSSMLADWGDLIYSDDNIDELSDNDPGDLRPGDLLFYGVKDSDGKATKVSHVAIYLGQYNLANGDTNYYQMECLSSQQNGFLVGNPNGAQICYFRTQTSKSGTRPLIQVRRVIEPPITQTGFLTLHKSSDNSNVLYDLSGAEYTVYEDEDCKIVANDVNGNPAILETDSKGSTNTIELNVGDYWVKETKAPSSGGYEIDDTQYPITITADHTKDAPLTINAEDSAITTHVALTKSSANTSITNGNGCYSLIGAEFTLYTDSGCTTVAKDANGKDAVLRVSDEVGTTNTLEMAFGTYYVKETKAPTGYYWDSESGKNDSTIHIYKVPLTSKYSASNPYTIKISDNPMNDPASITIYKEDDIIGSGAQGDASLEGALFTIEYYDGYYETESSLPSSAKRTWVIQTKQVGDKYIAMLGDDWKVSGDDWYYSNSGLVVLPLGTYVIYESSAPTGYLLKGTFTDENGVSKQAGEKFISVLKDQDDAIWITGGNIYGGEDVVIRGGVQIQKVDNDWKTANPQGDGSLKDATFEIVNNSTESVWVNEKLYGVGEVVATIKTDESGVAKTSSDLLPYGSYIIREVDASEGYLIPDGYSQNFTIRKEGEIVELSTTFDEPIQRGGVIISKVDEDLWGLGSSHKWQPEGNAILEGIEYEIINESENPVYVNGKTYAVGDVIMTITSEWDSTEGQYIAKTDNYTLPYGTYRIRETEISTGYDAGSAIERTFSITYDGDMEDLREDPVENPVIRGGVKIAKWDYELVEYDTSHADLPEGDTTLAGAVFNIINDSENCVVVDKNGDGEYSADEEFEPGEVVMTITTEWDESEKKYIAKTSDDALPYGHYIITEVEAPNGYLNEGILTREFDITYDGQMYDLTANILDPDTTVDAGIINYVIRGGFELQKRDAQTALAEPQGSASFDNIEFYLVNESDYCVLVDVNANGTIDADEHFEPGEVIMNFYLDDTGYYISDEYLLPYGSYRIYEVNILGEDGYLYGSGNFIDSYPDYGDYETTHVDMLADANVVIDFEIRTNAKIVNLTGVDDEYGESEVELTPTNDPTNSIYDMSDPDNENMVASGYAVEDLVKRGDIALRKQMGDDQSTPDGPIEWKLTSETTGETHYFWTDNNGDYSSDSTWNAHTYKTNVGEDYTDGIWFYGYATDVNGDAVAEYGTSDVGLDADHLEAVDNSLGALPYDTYILEELPGEYNEGMELITTEVEIYRDMRVVDLGTLDNYAHGFSTKATNAENGTQYANAGQYTVIDDEIEYWGLTAGKEYTFITQLYDKTTGEMILDEDGNEMSWEQTFTPHSKDGSATVEILFDATGLDGHTLVVFEYLYDEDGNLETAEEDKDEEDQMIYFPLIGTELTANDGGHYSVAGDSITLTDTVAYEGLPTMKWITMSGVLYDKETGEPLIDADGKEVSAEKKWFNTSEDGEVEIEFTFNASLLAGDSVVASEEAYVNDVLIAHHFDWDDEDQTVSFPSVGTTMVNNWTGEHQATVFENHNIDFTDTVAYTGLDTTKQYIVIGYLMDPETQEVVVDANGLEVMSQSEVFTPESPDGTIEVHFDFFAFGLHDTYTVAFEYLYEVDENNVGTLIAQHTDYDDAGQTVQLMKPTLWTDASITGTDSNQTDATDEVDITDMLDITGLIVGHTYYVYGKAVYEDGTPVLDATTGEPVELYNMFVADAEEMELDIMNFVFDATGLDGQAVIFEEYMYADEDRTILITEEEDLGAYEQTIFFNTAPVIGTTLVDDTTGTHEAVSSSTVSLTDTIAYEGLTVGEAYVATGTLMNKETGEKLLDANGNEITAETTFTANTPSGTVKVEFTFDASGLSGTSAVAFEQVYSVEGKLIASHEDINDENQTVLLTNLSIGTTLLDEYTGTHTAFVSRNGKSTVRLIDTIAYDGLTVGEEYTVYGVLMNKDTGERLTDSEGNAITASDTFKAETETGYAYVVFEFDSTDLAGVSTVAYEYLYDSDDTDTAIATHTDINDEAQTVYISGPIIGTNATESSTGNKTVEAGQVSITDTVDYAGLIEGEQYTLVGYAVNPSTGEAIKDAGGNIVTNNMPFMADATAGSVDVIFPFDASNLSGETIVFVEYLYYGQSTDMDDLIAWHFDLNDEAQSIYIGYPSTQIVTTSVPTEITTTTSTTSTKAPTTKQTADLRYIWILVAVAGCAAVAVAVDSKRRVKVRK